MVVVVVVVVVVVSGGGSGGGEGGGGGGGSAALAAAAAAAAAAGVRLSASLSAKKSKKNINERRDMLTNTGSVKRSPSQQGLPVLPAGNC